jgi:hypothetical protein
MKKLGLSHFFLKKNCKDNSEKNKIKGAVKLATNTPHQLFHTLLAKTFYILRNFE